MNSRTDEETQFVDLNDDIINLILKKLNRRDQISLRKINKEFYHNKDLKIFPKFLDIIDSPYFYQIKNPDFVYKNGIVTFDNFSFKVDDPDNFYFFKLRRRNVVFTSDSLVFKKNDTYVVEKFESKIRKIFTLDFYQTIMIETENDFYYYSGDNIYKSENSKINELNMHIIRFIIGSFTLEFSIYINGKNKTHIISCLEISPKREAVEKYKLYILSELDIETTFVKHNLRLISKYIDSNYKKIFG